MLAKNIILVLATLGLFQGFFLFIYLFTLKKGNRILNIYLSLILLGLTIRIGKSILGYYIPLEAWQKNIGISGSLIVGPVLWFYGIILFQRSKTLSKSYYLHLLPFTLFALMLTFIPSNGDFETFWNYGLVVFHLAIYLIVSWFTLIRSNSKTTLKKSKWYRNILIGVTLIWIYYLGNFLNLKLHYIWGPIFYSFLIYAFTYLFLNRDNFNIEKYENSGLDTENSIALFKKIKKLFENENLFLDPTISLNTLSEKLSKSSKEVSQSINQNAQQNFREFVNKHRIERAKALLVDLESKDEKMATVAYDSGFGTVTAFNIAFKKITGLTPSAYQKENISN
ncbi:helix-turn-helix domain-containing protein [Galbibacter sp. EGI 63066]|uniref:AraC family transcriptional regulator n=1 Tax=Galbibacter sp. EGI 63066 TaxID=2993559 RepID=UPI002248DE0B|nr:helix-turn-helix domain-containing protein [Galbibacter sp. EGI 63066]MCX2680260.1 helix-turn-helix domain-containing protein [Galbibacter sp. EGI 63066]